jgi:NADPH:quinone reductase-like Zn-dependent oxidoreductase
MKAIQFHSYGGPQVLQYEEIAVPSINSDEILVRVHSAGVGPFDVHVRQGWYKDSSNYPLPCILGWELSGVVMEAGAGITLFKREIISWRIRVYTATAGPMQNMWQ